MITTKQIAMELCKLEGLKKQVNIAQMSEIATKLPEFLYNNKDRLDEIMEYFLSGFMTGEDSYVCISKERCDGKNESVKITVEF